ncbi:MAG: oligosaccharide flippase family protein, partial [Candidatus Odinarchaeota archaeon]
MSVNLGFQNFKSFLGEFKTDLLSKIGVQISTLYLSQIAALILGVVTGIINTRILGPEGYGLFTFFFSFTTFIVLFFRFGFFTSASLLAAQVINKNEEREIVGASIIIALLIGISYSFTIFILSFFVDQIFNINIGWLMRYLSFVLTPLPFQLLIPNLARGTNKISMLALFYVVPSVIYIIGALTLIQIIPIQAYYFILLNTFSIIISSTIILYIFNPVFKNIRGTVKKIFEKNKEYGFHVYAGQVADQSTAK